jgi:biotin transport system substrate-specific component
LILEENWKEKMTTLSVTLSNRYLSRVPEWVRDLFLIVAGSLLVALFAQIEIPLQPVPITGQTFAVLLVGALMGARRGGAALSLYLIEGISGLPFFSGGASGSAYLFGATGGYLIGFVAAAYAIGVMAERGLERNFRTSLIPFLVGTAIIYICGIAWLALVLGSLQQAVIFGLLPFLVGDALKLIAAAIALPSAWKLINR